MRGFVSGCIIIAVVVVGALATDQFTFEDCGGEDKIGRVNNLVFPSPISLSDFLTVTLDVNFDQDVPEGAIVKTNFYKVKYLFGLPINIPVPCIMGRGTCTMEHCDYLVDRFDILCPFFPKGQLCSCPITAGHYKGENVLLGKLDIGHLGKYLARGHFRYEFRILSPDRKKLLFCAILNGKLTT